LVPYVAYADAYPAARSGWLEASDPIPAWEVGFSDEANAQISWLSDRGVKVRAAIEAALALGPQPHPYHRIRPTGSGMRLALKDWRIDFDVEERRIVVRALSTGYRAHTRQILASRNAMVCMPQTGCDEPSVDVRRTTGRRRRRPRRRRTARNGCRT
jgi:hypothetical protein